MKYRLGCLMVAGALASACGGGESSSTPPTAPASQASATANGSSGSTSADGTKTGTTTRADGVTGIVSGVAGACPSVTFKVDTRTVKTDAATTYVTKSCADLKDGVRVGVSGTAQADGSLLAKSVKFAPPPPPPPAEGTVSALSGTCPSITFTVAGKTFTTDSLTRFSSGGCAAVKNDAKVGVAYQTRVDGSVRVLTVKVVPPPLPPPALSGVVTALTGTCPVITITLGTKVAMTSAATVFQGKACADVKVGMKVAIYGTIATGATVLAATKVVTR